MHGSYKQGRWQQAIGERVGQQLCGDMNIKGMEGGEGDIPKTR